MLIDLASVGKTPQRLEVSFDAQEIELDDEAAIDGKADFVGEIERDGNRTIVRGTITATAMLACSRCLDPVRHVLDFGFRDIFVDASESGVGDETEVLTDGLDESFIANSEIDLAEVIREQIVLELPEQIFCKVDCKGLCPRCGENLNLIDCKCSDNEIDPRWAALKDFK